MNKQIVKLLKTETKLLDSLISELEKNPPTKYDPQKDNLDTCTKHLNYLTKKFSLVKQVRDLRLNLSVGSRIGSIQEEVSPEVAKNNALMRDVRQELKDYTFN